MGKIVLLQIQNQQHELTVKEYQGQRVVTFKDIDEVHGRPEGTAGRNFRENRDRFIKGEDYFAVPRKELPTNFVVNSKEGNPNIEVVLITESGYLMLVKSFTDDLAWQVQRQLVNGYFRAKEIKSAPVNVLRQSEVEARLRNSRSREANVLLKIANKPEIPVEYKQVLYSYASQIIAGHPLLPLPEAEKMYKAEDIATEFGTTANMVGRIANANNLKVPENGKWVWDKSPYSSKQVLAWQYNEAGRKRVEELLRNIKQEEGL